MNRNIALMAITSIPIYEFYKKYLNTKINIFNPTKQYYIKKCIK